LFRLVDSFNIFTSLFSAISCLLGSAKKGCVSKVRDLGQSPGKNQDRWLSKVAFSSTNARESSGS
jgi:hypothetical protein